MRKLKMFRRRAKYIQTHKGICMRSFPSRGFAGSVLLSSLLIGAGALTASAAPLASCGEPIVSLGNPSPGDMLMPGGYTIDGVAFDPMSAQPQQSGISNVSIFLDNRDEGGIDLGNTTTGFVPNFTPADEEALPSATNPGAFHLVVSLPSNVVGGHNIVAYARSALTGQETVVSVPVVLGESPTRAGLDVANLTESNSNPGAAPSNCSAMTTAPSPAAATVTTPETAAQAPAASAAVSPAPTATRALTLQLENPSGGDTIHVGGNVVSGMAFDPASQSGSGIDRVSFVLGDRNQGGIDILDITPTANQFTTTVTFPTSHMGAQILFVYAHSALSGAETSVAIPITIVQ